MSNFLYDYQLKAVEKMRNGCILNGSVGSGKSRTGLYYYFTKCGGNPGTPFRHMTIPKDLYIITTARKRDTMEWEDELLPFRLSPNPKSCPYVKIVIDSWNNIKKYKEVKDCFFIFDEDRVTGSGAWVKAFLTIAKHNEWIILSATPGDTWMDYIPVFIANGFYKNKTQFITEHVVYCYHTDFPKIDRYVNTGKLMRLRNRILVDMAFKKHTIPHHEDIFTSYDINMYKQVIRTRWDPYKDEPIPRAADLCYVLRRVVNTSDSRSVKVLELFEKHPKMIIFYNFDYELEILKNLYYGEKVEVAEWNGHKHQPLPESDSWVYLVNYVAGAEGWNCVKTDTIVFYSQNYSYKTINQSAGRIDRLNTPFVDLYYYHLKSKSSIDIAISKALREKKDFNINRFMNGNY